jgi:DNA repair protein RecN (Recombination protein N)
VEAVQAVHQLVGYDSGNGAGEQIGGGMRELSRVTQYDPQLETLENSLGEIDSLLNDFNRELSSYLDSLTFDDETFYETERRLDLINGMKSKYGSTIEEILDYQVQRRQKLEKLTRYDENFQEAKAKLHKAEQKLKSQAHSLSLIRQEYARTLSEKVIEGLKDLNFLDVDFDIRFSKKKGYTAGGTDEVEYEISTNPGESRKPLGKIVSGGELSRIMLALKAILADRDQIETLIFDEIDTGISGRTAQKVSEKMALIGRNHQVLCITHLPQIASMADTHFEIEKHVTGSETTTQIHPLDEEASVRELARLLGGAQITPAVLENAREMKELARVHKNERLK